MSLCSCGYTCIHGVSRISWPRTAVFIVIGKRHKSKEVKIILVYVVDELLHSLSLYKFWKHNLSRETLLLIHVYQILKNFYQSFRTLSHFPCNLRIFFLLPFFPNLCSKHGKKKNLSLMIISANFFMLLSIFFHFDLSFSSFLFFLYLSFSLSLSLIL